MKNQITVITVTYNSQSTIKNCLDSIIKYSSDSEIIVVDNNSHDGTREVVKKYNDKAILIEPSENLGFARANNLALDKVNTEFVVFLNPDTSLVESGSLEDMKQSLVDHQDYGLIGPKLLYPDGSVRKTVRNLPTIGRAFGEYILGQKGVYDFYQPNCQSLCEVESVVGACMMMRRDVFKKVGRFDEKFFLYYEDLELCRSIKKLGLKVGYLPSVKVEHIEGVSGTGSSRTGDLLYQSAKKYHGFLEFYLISLIIRASRFLHF
jgi:GT2 family glycosyltransferase